ncbi:MAG TPA: phosphatidylserine decarboxylase family protein [Thermoanaerobaculia bacterium]|nr:phosphatidylserine decarboxylase family protein [Thermoanaerobaculia bacterium]
MSEASVVERYRNLIAYRAGYLPRDIRAVDDFLDDLSKIVAKRKAKKKKLRSPAVRALQQLIELDGIVRMYVTQMLREPQQKHTIYTIDGMLHALDEIVETAPAFNPNPALLNNFPVSSLFTYMMMTPGGEAAFRNTQFNGAIRVVLQEWCAYLDSAASRYVLTTDRDGWLSQPAYQMNQLFQFVIPDQSKPHWGFPSFNAYFHREIKSEFRPLAGPRNPKVVVSANDGTVVKISRNIKKIDDFWLKGEPYSLINMLNGHKYVDRFVGGDVFQSFLSGADYHRWHAPVDGVVRHAEIVDGLMFSDAESAGSDPTAATYSQQYETSVNTRGLVFIESKTVGLVCVMPIGITEISSVTINVKKGDRLKKGAELGYFSYGGSSMALIFERGAIDHFTVSEPAPGSQNIDNGEPVFVNAQIAVAK